MKKKLSAIICIGLSSFGLFGQETKENQSAEGVSVKSRVQVTPQANQSEFNIGEVKSSSVQLRKIEAISREERQISPKTSSTQIND
jgi:hypothetical protein